MKAPAIAIAFLALGPAALAQDAVVLAVEGWSHSERDGLVSYRCASAICAAGSVVSHTRQPHRPSLTLAVFERHHRGDAEENRKNGRNTRDVRLFDVQEQTVERVKVFALRREVDWGDGTTTYSINALLTGPQSSYSVASDAKKLEWSVGNSRASCPA